MKDTPTITEAIQAARESTRIAELDLRRAVSAACGYTDAGSAALHKVLEDSILPVCNVAKLLSHLLQFPEGVTVHAAADADRALLVGALAPDSAQNDMAQYRKTLEAVPQGHSRIPSPIVDGKKCATTWANRMILLGLAYNITDDPSDITTDEGRTMFNATECNELRNIVATFTEEDAEEYLGVLVARVHEQAAPPEPEPIEPPPFKPSQRCTHVRGDGKRCTRLTWATEEGHEHRFPCAGRVPGTQDTCDGDEGHSGPCFQIPF